MSRTKSVRGKLSHVPFKKSIDPLFEWQIFMGLDFEMKYKLIENYLIAIFLSLPGELKTQRNYKLANSAFFQAAFLAFREVADATHLRFGNYKVESLEEVLSPIEEIDWRRHSGTNKKAIKELSEEIIHITTKGQKLDADML